VYPRSELCDAEVGAQRLLSAMGEIVVMAGAHRISPTASGGLVSITEMPPGAEPADLLKAADAALYRAKCAGRDRLIVGRD